MDRVFSIALDGPSGAGKSSVAKAIANELEILYLDTGAMYRAMGLYILRNGVDPRDAKSVERICDFAPIDVRHVDGAQSVYLGDEDVSEAIRSAEASLAASAVSSVPRVREKLVASQREIARGKSVVMDGRDIGTHVLPDATLKVFLTAPVKVRAKRRHEELVSRGVSDSYEQVLRDMIRRDHDDSTRSASPLEKADDAVELDTRDMDIDAVVRSVIALLNAKLGVSHET